MESRAPKPASRLLKGKAWYTILAPKLFGEKPLGEALASDPSALIGRIVTSSLTEMTGDPARYYMTLKFKITSIDGNLAKTSFAGHECTRDFVARIVQLRTERIDTNDVLQMKDGKLRVKAIAICNRRVTKGVAMSVRKKLSELISAQAKNKTIEDFVQLFISGALQNQIRAQVNKIYPLRAFEIRKTEVL